MAVLVDKYWYRGCVTKCDRTDKRYEYRVLLIDYGREIDVHHGQLRILPEQFNTDRLQSQFIKIALYGVIPIYFDIGLASESRFRYVCHTAGVTDNLLNDDYCHCSRGT